MASFKYLHETHPNTLYFDNKLVPEVRAMFSAMASRMPSGGIKQRYQEVVEAVAKSIFREDGEAAPDFSPNRPDAVTWEDIPAEVASKILAQAEDRLCAYPLHPRVQKFFDQFVGRYGHSSIMELVGSPAVFVEGVSWWTAYQLFDNPLCAGQEFSTRAVRHKDWPMCLEAMPPADEQYRLATVPGTEDPLRNLHERWLTLFEHEVEAWQDHLKDPKVRSELGIADKEPFRPALDRARWAIPGTIATGCSHTANLRVMARTIRDGQALAANHGSKAAQNVWEDIRKVYRDALPGLADMGLREAVYDAEYKIPGHLRPLLAESNPEDEDVWVGLHVLGVPDPAAFSRAPGAKAYIDPSFNHAVRADVSINCSLAVARDWHRHRTFYPWRMYLVRGDGEPFRIHHLYEPLSGHGKEHLEQLLADSTALFDEFMEANDYDRAMLCLPLGTQVEMVASGGLRDAIYMFELRGYAHGANFEYKQQALDAIGQIRSQIAHHDAKATLEGTPLWGPYLGYSMDDAPEEE